MKTKLIIVFNQEIQSIAHNLYKSLAGLNSVVQKGYTLKNRKIIPFRLDENLTSLYQVMHYQDGSLSTTAFVIEFEGGFELEHLTAIEEAVEVLKTNAMPTLKVKNIITEITRKEVREFQLQMQ